MSTRSREPLALVLAGAHVLAWSGFAPWARAVWRMEVFPTIAGAVALVIRACYELLDCQAAICAAPEPGEAALGAQGDTWDAKKDMTMALIGSIADLLRPAATS